MCHDVNLEYVLSCVFDHKKKNIYIYIYGINRLLADVSELSVADPNGWREFDLSPKQKQAWVSFPTLLISWTLLLQPIMTSCYSLLEQYITRFDLSFELMLNELWLLLSQTQNSSP